MGFMRGHQNHEEYMVVIKHCINELIYFIYLSCESHPLWMLTVLSIETLHTFPW